MKGKLRELAERWKGRSSKFTPEGDLAFAYNRCADELLAILDAEGDGGAVPFGWVNFIGELSVTKKNSDDTPVFTHPARSGVSEEDVLQAIDDFNEILVDSLRIDSTLSVRLAMRTTLESFIRNRK